MDQSDTKQAVRCFNYLYAAQPNLYDQRMSPAHTKWGRMLYELIVVVMVDIFFVIQRTNTTRDIHYHPVVQHANNITHQSPRILSIGHKKHATSLL